MLSVCSGLNFYIIPGTQPRSGDLLKFTVRHSQFTTEGAEKHGEEHGILNRLSFIVQRSAEAEEVK